MTEQPNQQGQSSLLGMIINAGRSTLSSAAYLFKMFFPVIFLGFLFGIVYYAYGSIQSSLTFSINDSSPMGGGSKYDGIKKIIDDNENQKMRNNQLITKLNAIHKDIVLEPLYSDDMQ